MAPNGAGRIFILLIQTLPTFWATWILILRIFIFGIFFDPKVLAWAQLGPGLDPPTWARLGPPTWARLGGGTYVPLHRRHIVGHTLGDATASIPHFL